MITAPPFVNVEDANGKPLSIEEQIIIHVRIGSKTELVTFYVVQRISTAMILCCDFFNKHVWEIRTRARTVELDDCKTDPILLKQCPRSQNDPPLPEYQYFALRHKRVSPKGRTVNLIVVSAESKTWVKVQTKREGLILVPLTRETYDSHLCLAATTVAQVKPDEQFCILLANFQETEDISS